MNKLSAQGTVTFGGRTYALEGTVARDPLFRPCPADAEHGMGSHLVSCADCARFQQIQTDLRHQYATDPVFRAALDNIADVLP